MVSNSPKPTGAELPPLPAPGSPRRLEGRDKLTGRARYAGDFTPDLTGGVLDAAVVVTSTQATGRILHIDASAARQLPGVRLILTHENAPRLHTVLATNGAEIGNLLPLQDDQLHYYGQAVAVVVADTLATARDAAALVHITYSPPDLGAAFTLAQGRGRAADVKKVGAGDPGQVQVGHPEKAFAAASHQVDMTFNTAAHHHNAMEPGAIVAAWEADGGLTVHLPTQFSYGDAVILGEAFGFGLKERLPNIVAQVLGGIEFHHKVRVISTMTGGAFGSKNANVHLLLAPMAAKLTGRPVKLVLDRAQTFTLMPFRGEMHQRIRLGADAEGRLQAVLHDALLAKGTAGQFVAPIGEGTTKVYATPNLGLHVQAAALDTNAPGWMRGPGAPNGQFALESALDTLAHQLGLDPLEIRLRNYAETEPDTGKEWSSKALRECYTQGAARVGWHQRNPQVGSMRAANGRLLGYGMATAIYPTLQLPARARVVLGTDGRAVVQTANHEIGQGMITAFTQLAAETLGLPLEHVRLEWGDTRLPYGGMTVGSMTTLSGGAAIQEAAQQVQKTLLQRVVADKASPLLGLAADQLRVENGRIVAPNGASETVAAAMARHPEAPIQEEATTGRTMGHSSYGREAFGAEFAVVSVDPDTMHVQVERLVGAFAGGRILNPLLVRSQLMGSMVWGLGQALLEQTEMDERTGHWTNDSLGEALIPTNADVADIDIILVEEDDSRGHPLGVKGLGELGITGVAAAIANAIFHATGQRITSLPITLDKLLGT
ncbi:xanthine dehydrogenase family protein molybdopterin-binding subunit [Hymenobacter sp. GOD-10R]|uniref:xanthine dehydrogenase family protein molybdopterin-binding subunit n=1 Tax=Hymenobacter sp. GOD-10R TaxID=3093922 RepID=UPI002D76F9E1|nr:xanthine dehydrogenase family protein molybdopterin-binding subunit [Hymenobacter sp. GOD-10R]WRQ31291.1 xanthine dehydrogenase family protein molybdopterin-binding subunit [Hymenobacter sp. GOD-10R]